MITATDANFVQHVEGVVLLCENDLSRTHSDMQKLISGIQTQSQSCRCIPSVPINKPHFVTLMLCIACLLCFGKKTSRKQGVALFSFAHKTDYVI